MKSSARRWWMVAGILLVVLVVLAPRRVYTPTVAIMPGGVVSESAALEWNSSDVVESVLLLGDSGDAVPAVWEPLVKHLQIIPDRTTVVMMGDNVYGFGIPPEDDPGYAEAARRLSYQTDKLKAAGVRAVFIPGNHDWNADRDGGLRAVERQEELVLKALGPGSFAPSNGCPGPATVHFSDRFQVIAIDSEWWLYQYEKPPLDGGACPQSDFAELSRDIASALQGGAPSALRLLVMHHPLMSHGQHGEGSSCPGDSGCPPYREFRKQLFSTLQNVEGVICAAGHDHILEVLRGAQGCDLFLVSGAASRPRGTRVASDTLYALEQHGFMRIDVTDKGERRLTVFAIDTGSGAVSPAYFKSLGIEKTPQLSSRQPPD